VEDFDGLRRGRGRGRRWRPARTAVVHWRDAGGEVPPDWGAAPPV